MTVASGVVALATAIGADIKALLRGQGELSSLATTDKNSLVGAVNEVRARTPKITVGATAPASPAVGDLWVDTN